MMILAFVFLSMVAVASFQVAILTLAKAVA